MPDESYQAFLDHSRAVARRVLPFMGEKGIPATPENYMIFYAYFEGGSDVVTRVVEEYLSKGQWDELASNRVFRQLFGAEAYFDWRKRNEHITEQIRDMARGIMEQTEATADLASQTHRRICISLKDAEQLRGVKEMANWLRTVLGEISQMEQVSRSLGQALNERARQLDGILRSLDDVEMLILTDELTKLPNRRAWKNRLEEEFQRFRRYQNPVSVIMVDIDNFKSLNDEHGHLVGDQALKHVSRLLGSSIRNTDFVARFGGEEFVALLPETDLQNGVTAAENLRAKLAKTVFTIHGQPRPITASFGVAQLAAEDDVPDGVVERADQALLLAKARGKNRVCHEGELPARNNP